MTVLIGGGNEFDALVYGYQHPGTAQYLEENIQRLGQQVQSFGQTVSDAGRAFYQSAQDLYGRFNNSDAMRMAHAAVRKVQLLLQPEMIRPLNQVSCIQNASLTMQRWIMAEPTARQHYHEQRCDGYGDTYVDMHPGFIGQAHYDWRRVHHGLLVEDETDPENFRVTFYLDELAEGDRELTLTEQMDVLNTWDFVKQYFDKGADDPTSPLAAML